MNKGKGGFQSRFSENKSQRLNESMCNLLLSSSASNFKTSLKSKRCGKVEDILLYKFKESQSRIEKKRKQREEEIMQEVTGKPTINSKSAELAQLKLVKELTSTIRGSKFSQSSRNFSKYIFSSVAEDQQGSRRSMDPYDIPSAEKRQVSPRVHVDIKNRKFSGTYFPVVVTDQHKLSGSQGVASPNSLRASILNNFQEAKTSPNFYDMNQTEREKCWLTMKEAKLESQRKLKSEKELDECTFKPKFESKQTSAIINKSTLKELNSIRDNSTGYSSIHSKKQSIKSRSSHSVPRLALGREPEAESPVELKSLKCYFEKTNNLRTPPPNPTSPWPKSFTPAELHKQIYRGVIGKFKNTTKSKPELRISIKSVAESAPELINTGYYKQLSPISYRYKTGCNIQTVSTKPSYKPTVSSIKSISLKPSTPSTKTVISKSSSKK